MKMSKEYFLQGCAQSSTKNGKDLTEAEEIKKRWQEYTEELYKKGLNGLHNHDAVVTYLKPKLWSVMSKGP